jgi:hypothetical protein
MIVLVSSILLLVVLALLLLKFLNSPGKSKTGSELLGKTISREFTSRTTLLCQPPGSIMIATGKVCEENGMGQMMVKWESIRAKNPQSSCIEQVLTRTNDSAYNTQMFGDCGIDATLSGLNSMVDIKELTPW